MGKKSMFIRPEMCRKFEIAFLNHLPLIVYDLETTGLKKTDVIVQFSAIKLDYNSSSGGYIITDKINLYIKPPFKMPEEASIINRITDQMLEGKPDESEVFPLIQKFFERNRDAVVCGYNILHFDNAMMNTMFLRCSERPFAPAKTIDIMVMAMEILDRENLPDKSFKQASCASVFGINEEGLHAADIDTMVSAKLMFHLYHKYKDNCIDYAVEKQKPRIYIKNMYAFKKSKFSNFVIISAYVNANGQTIVGQIHYDRYNHRYVQDSGNLFEIGNRLQFTIDADRLSGGSIDKFKKIKKERDTYAGTVV